jgi:hypothetical protein
MSDKIIRIKKQRLPFTQIPNDFICNPNISSTAKSLWCILYSKPDDWTFYWKEIESNLKEGRDAIRRACNQLKELGYIQKTQKRISTGRGKETKYGGMEIDLFYDPLLPFEQENKGLSLNTENQYTGNEDTGNEDTENQCTNKDLLKKDLSNKDLSNFSFSNKSTATLEELEEYKKQKKYNCNVKGFFDLNESRGWKYNGQKIEDRYQWLDCYEERNTNKPDVKKSLTTEKVESTQNSISDFMRVKMQYCKDKLKNPDRLTEEDYENIDKIIKNNK